MSSKIKAAIFLLFLLPSHASAQRPRSIEELALTWNGLSAESRRARILAEAKKERQVIWYAPVGLTLIEQIVAAFNRRYPFIEVKYYRAKGRDVTERFLTEGRNDIHSADLIRTGPSFLTPLIRAGLIAAYQSSAREEIPKEFRGKLWTGTDLSTRVLGWNTKMLGPSQVPKRWEDLLQSKWKGKIMMDAELNDDIMALIAVWGQKKASEYFEKLAAQELLIQRGRTLIAQLVAAGEAPLAVTVLPNEVENLRAKGAPIDWAPLDQIPAHVGLIGMAKYPPHPHAAALFYDFLLSAEGQRDQAETGRTVTNPKIKSRLARIEALKSNPGLLLFTPDNIKTEWTEEALAILDGVLLKGKI